MILVVSDYLFMIQLICKKYVVNEGALFSNKCLRIMHRVLGGKCKFSKLIFG